MSKQVTTSGRKIVAALRKPIQNRGEGYELLYTAAGKWVRWRFRLAGIPNIEAENMARDVVTDVAMEKIERFEGDGELFFAWLNMLVTNRIRSYHRVAKRIEPFREDEADDSAIASPDGNRIKCAPVPRDNGNTELVPKRKGLLFSKPVRDALKTLSTADRRLLYARAEGISVEVTASMLGLSQSNVKVKYMRITSRLRKVLENNAQKNTGGNNERNESEKD